MEKAWEKKKKKRKAELHIIEIIWFYKKLSISQLCLILENQTRTHASHCTLSAALNSVHQSWKLRKAQHAYPPHIHLKSWEQLKWIIETQVLLLHNEITASWLHEGLRVGFSSVSSSVRYVSCAFHQYSWGEHEYRLHIWMVMQHQTPAFDGLLHVVFDSALGALHVQSYDSHWHANYGNTLRTGLNSQLRLLLFQNAFVM